MTSNKHLTAYNAAESSTEDCVSPAVLTVNQYSAASKDNWVLIAPYGQFPNNIGGKRIIQCFTKQDAEDICNEFDSTTSMGVKAMGLPWYIGHPDHPDFKAQYKDTSAKGRIKELEARPDGLYANVKWNDEGKLLINSESFHGHSIAWRMKPDAMGNWHPFSLKSVGFTNEPNIPVPAITTANEKENSMSKKNDNQEGVAKKPTLLDHIATLLGKPDIAKEGANEEDAAMAINEFAAGHKKLADENESLKAAHAELKGKHDVLNTMCNSVFQKYGANEAGELPADVVTTLTGAEFTLPDTGIVAALANEVSSVRVAIKAKDVELVSANQRIADMELTASNQRKELAGSLLGFAVSTGCLTANERSTMEKDVDFANEAQFVAMRSKVLAMKPKINVLSQVGALGHISAEIGVANQRTISRTDAIIEAVNEHQDAELKKSGKRPDYMKAFAHVQRKRPELFVSEDAMTR